LPVFFHALRAYIAERIRQSVVAEIIGSVIWIDDVDAGDAGFRTQDSTIPIGRGGWLGIDRRALRSAPLLLGSGISPTGPKYLLNGSVKSELRLFQGYDSIFFFLTHTRLFLLKGELL
jgi:hypothetical protein